MKRTLLFLGLSLLLAATPFTGSVNAEGKSVPKPQGKEVIRKQIDREREKQVQYHIKEFKSLDKSARQSFLSDYNYPVQEQRLSLDSIDSEQYVENYFEDLLANAYIYTMDDNGYVYDKEGDVVNQLDLSEAAAPLDSKIATDTLSNNGLITTSVNLDSSINGYSSGAFARQVTTSGYKGIKTSFILPTDAYFNTPNSSIVGYLYNGIDVLSSSQLGGYKLEGGLQYSEDYDNYTAVIHPQGVTQNAIPEGYSTEPPRYVQGTSIISNLLYDTASSQFKYFVNGTIAGGANQYIYFYYSKSLTSTQLSALTVKRVVALAKDGYTGTNIGNVQVTYTGTTVTTTSGTPLDLTSAMLSSHYYNGITYGTADTPASAVTKAGGITTQKINVNTTGF